MALAQGDEAKIVELIPSGFGVKSFPRLSRSRDDNEMVTQGAPHLGSDFLSGALGGMAGIVVGHPFDTTKVQLQVQYRGANSGGLMNAVLNISRHGLARGFFRGMAFPLYAYGAVNSVLFGVYGNVLRGISVGKEPCPFDIYLAGCAGGAGQLLLACPVDVVKCTLQSHLSSTGIHDNKFHFTGPIRCLQFLWQQRGILGLYRGLNVMALRDIPTYGLYMVLYDVISSTISRRCYGSSHAFLGDVIGGGLAGSLSWLSIMPVDFLKSRLQADVEGQYRGMIHCATCAVRQEGLTVFYRGTLVTCLRGFPVNGVTFLVYNRILGLLTDHRSEV